MSKERMLNDDAPVEDDQKSIQEAPPRESLSPDEFAAGVRAVRRSCKVFPNGHLLAEFDALGEEIVDAPDDADVDDLIDQYEALAVKVKESVRYVAEARSRDWQLATRKEIIKRLKIKVDAKGVVKSESDSWTVAYALIAAQIVEPADVTGATIRAISVGSKREGDKIANTVQLANNTSVEDVQARDFSSRRSQNRGTQGSSDS